MDPLGGAHIAFKNYLKKMMKMAIKTTEDKFENNKNGYATFQTLPQSK